jgi:histidine ammonia-lyase
MAVDIGVEPFTREQLVSVARGFESVTLSDAVVTRLELQRAAIDALVESGTPVYGLSTGFGSLATTFISPDERRDLQRSLIRSHAAGVGPEVEIEVVRAMMVSRLTNLCSGVSGVRPSTAQAYAALLNAGITPVVHEFGSLGCSGDLAPLAHVALEGDSASAPPQRCARAASRRSSWPRRRAWRSSTEPTECSGS